MKIGSLFSGYGGLDLAVEEVFGATTAWHVEWDAAPAKILAHHWPDVPNYRDVTTVDWADVEPVDIITGGSPCQDLSNAGKLAGMREGTRSNLWVNMREAIAQLQPRYVVWENVRGALYATASSASDLEQYGGLLGKGEGHLRALGRVLGDLSELGYDAAWSTVRASSVGAPHHRPRVFLLAERQLSAHPNRGDHLPPAGELVGESEAAAPIESAGRVLPQHAAASAVAQHLVGSASSSATRFGIYEPVVSRWERSTRPAPHCVAPDFRGRLRLNPEFAEWMMGLPAGWVTSPEIGLGREAQLKAIGNGVCPQQAAAALRELLALGAAA